MTVPQRVAMTLPHKLGVKETMDLAVWAEERGYDGVWFADNSDDALRRRLQWRYGQNVSG